jgi:hypothetical protein
VPLEGVLTYSISYCKDSIKCNSASNVPQCPLNSGVSIVQKFVVKLSNTSTTFSQQMEIALWKCLRVLVIISLIAFFMYCSNQTKVNVI